MSKDFHMVGMPNLIDCKSPAESDPLQNIIIGSSETGEVLHFNHDDKFIKKVSSVIQTCLLNHTLTALFKFC